MVHAHFEDKQNGFTVAGFIFTRSLKVKQTVEGEPTPYMKYKDKCSSYIRNRMTQTLR